MNVIAENMFKAIDILIDRKLSKLSFNKVVEAVIFDNSKASEGIYTVEIDNSYYEAFGNKDDYSLKEGVYVNILNNDYSLPKVILSRASSNKDIFSFFKSYIQISLKDSSLLANYSADLESVIYRTTDPVEPIDTITQIGIAGTFRTYLAGYDIKSGEYGLKVQISTENQTYTFILKIDNTFDYESTEGVYLFKCEDLQIEDYLDIKEIKVSLYQEDRSFKNSQGQVVDFSQEDIILDNLCLENAFILLGN